jgi:hypothetical protein
MAEANTRTPGRVRDAPRHPWGVQYARLPTLPLSAGAPMFGLIPRRYRVRRPDFSSSKNSRSFTPRALPICHSVTTVGLRWPNSRPLT